MKIVHLNEEYTPDDIDFVLLVTDYEYGCLEGDGDSLELGTEGQVRHRNLSHCSCYGPEEADVQQSWANVAEFILAQESVHGFSGSQKLVDAFISEVYKLHMENQLYVRD